MRDAVRSFGRLVMRRRGPIAVAVLLAGVLFAGLYRWRRCDNAGAVMVFAAVVSHWILDWISHKPDMPLTPAAAHV